MAPARLVPVEIPLAGVDKKTVIDHVEPGKLTIADNVTFRQPRALNKRNGFAALAAGPQTPRRVFTRGDELLAADDRFVFAYLNKDHGFPSWFARGAGCPRFSVARTSIFRDAESTSDTPACGGTNGYVAIAASGRYRIIETATGTMLRGTLNPVGISTYTANTARIVASAAGTKIYLFAMTNVGLYCTVFDTATATVAAAVVVSAASGTAFDVCMHGSGLVIAWAPPASANLHVENYDASLVLLNANTIVDAANVAHLTVAATSGEGVFVAWKNAAPDLRLAMCDAVTMVPVGAYPITIGAGVSPFHIGVVRSAASVFTVVTETVGAIDRLISWGAWGASGAVGGISTTGTIPMRLLSRPWIDDGAVYVLGFYQQDLTLALPDEIDRNAYIYRLSGYTGTPLAALEYHGAFARGIAAPITDDIPLPGQAFLATGHWQTAMRVKVATATTKQWTGQWSKTFFIAGRIGIDLVDIQSTANPGRFVTAPWGDALFIAGACATLYDGQVIYDGGHTSRPGVPVVSEQAGGHFNTPDSRTFVLVWEWSDNLDQLHRSAPSPPTTYQISGLSQYFKVTASTIPSGLKSTNAADVRCAVYRNTAADVDNFYRSGTVAVGAVYLDDVQDADLIYKEPLYTNGGTLDNTNWPPCTCAEYHQGRLWVGGVDDGQLWYSKPIATGMAPEFSEVLTLATDEQIVALKSLDFALIAWSARSIYAIYGDGHNNLGLGATLDVRRVSAATGCVSPQSVVVDDMGVFFQAQDGLYLLDRGLQLHKAGAPVDAVLANFPRVTGAVKRQSYPEIVFSVQDPTGGNQSTLALLYDTLTEQWATWSPPTGAVKAGSLAEWRGKLVLADEQTSHPIAVETATWVDAVYNGDPQAVTVAFETPNIQVSRGGWQRVKEIVLIGTAVGAHGVALVITRDGVTTDTITLTPTQIGAMTYGEQIRIRCPVQRCRTMRVRVLEQPVTSFTDSAGPRWTAVVFWVRPDGMPNRARSGAQV